MKKLNFVNLILILILVLSCSKKDDTTDTTEPSGTLGQVGNAWQVQVEGNNLSAEIIEKEGDIYTVQVSYAKMAVKTVKFGFANNEVVDYAYSNGDLSKPFPMVKFDANVGEMWGTTINGIYHHREVSEKETYHIPALNKDIETIGVYEWIPEEIPSSFFGMTIREIIWYWHPTYGLVCVDVYTDQGDHINVEFLQIDL